jgi:hypothetical protein
VTSEYITIKLYIVQSVFIVVLKNNEWARFIPARENDMIKFPEYAAPCISPFVLLGSFVRRSQAGVIRPVATGRMTVRAGTSAPGIRNCVMRPLARSARALCPKLEPLLEHDNL